MNSHSLSWLAPGTLAADASPSAIEHLYELVQGGRLDRQTRVRIALYLAGRGRSSFDPAALRECGRAAGMNGAEMTANEQGTSHDVKGTACLLFVKTLLEDPLAPRAQDLERMHAVGYRQDDIAEVMANVGINIILSRMTRVIDSPGEMVNCGQKNSLQLNAV